MPAPPSPRCVASSAEPVRICDAVVTSDGAIELTVGWANVGAGQEWIAVGFDGPNYMSMIDFVAGRGLGRVVSDRAKATAVDTLPPADAMQDWTYIDGTENYAKAGWARWSRPFISPDPTDYVFPSCTGTVTAPVSFAWARGYGDYTTGGILSSGIASATMPCRPCGVTLTEPVKFCSIVRTNDVIEATFGWLPSAGQEWVGFGLGSAVWATAPDFVAGRGSGRAITDRQRATALGVVPPLDSTPDWLYVDGSLDYRTLGWANVARAVRATDPANDYVIPQCAAGVTSTSVPFVWGRGPGDYAPATSQGSGVVDVPCPAAPFPCDVGTARFKICSVELKGTKVEITMGWDSSLGQEWVGIGLGAATWVTMTDFVGGYGAGPSAAISDRGAASTAGVVPNIDATQSYTLLDGSRDYTTAGWARLERDFQTSDNSDYVFPTCVGTATTATIPYMWAMGSGYFATTLEVGTEPSLVVPCVPAPPTLCPVGVGESVKVCQVTRVGSNVEILFGWGSASGQEWVGFGLGATQWVGMLDFVAGRGVGRTISDRGAATANNVVPPVDTDQNWAYMDGSLDYTTVGWARISRPFFSPDSSDYVFPVCVGSATTASVPYVWGAGSGDFNPATSAGPGTVTVPCTPAPPTDCPVVAPEVVRVCKIERANGQYSMTIGWAAGAAGDYIAVGLGSTSWTTATDMVVFDGTTASDRQRPVSYGVIAAADPQQHWTVVRASTPSTGNAGSAVLSRPLRTGDSNDWQPPACSNNPTPQTFPLDIVWGRGAIAGTTYAYIDSTGQTTITAPCPDDTPPTQCDAGSAVLRVCSVVQVGADLVFTIGWSAEPSQQWVGLGLGGTSWMAADDFVTGRGTDRILVNRQRAITDRDVPPADTQQSWRYLEGSADFSQPGWARISRVAESPHVSDHMFPRCPLGQPIGTMVSVNAVAGRGPAEMARATATEPLVIQVPCFAATVSLPCNPPGNEQFYICSATRIQNDVHFLVGWRAAFRQEWLGFALDTTSFSSAAVEMVTARGRSSTIYDRQASAARDFVPPLDTQQNWWHVDGSTDFTADGWAVLARPMVSPDSTDYKFPDCVGSASTATIPYVWAVGPGDHAAPWHAVADGTLRVSVPCAPVVPVAPLPCDVTPSEGFRICSAAAVGGDVEFLVGWAGGAAQEWVGFGLGAATWAAMPDFVAGHGTGSVISDRSRASLDLAVPPEDAVNNWRYLDGSMDYTKVGWARVSRPHISPDANDYKFPVCTGAASVEVVPFVWGRGPGLYSQATSSGTSVVSVPCTPPPAASQCEVTGTEVFKVCAARLVNADVEMLIGWAVAVPNQAWVGFGLGATSWLGLTDFVAGQGSGRVITDRAKPFADRVVPPLHAAQLWQYVDGSMDYSQKGWALLRRPWVSPDPGDYIFPVCSDAWRSTETVPFVYGLGPADYQPAMFVASGTVAVPCTARQLPLPVPSPAPAPELPVNPSGPLSPLGPLHPDHPGNPSSPTHPNNPINPLISTNPFHPANPANPANPFNPASPTSIFSPNSPLNPASPNNPTNPLISTNPFHPGNPANPANPVNPSSPTAVFSPNSPSNPASPNNPINPLISTNPFHPGNPANPANPVKSNPPYQPIQPLSSVQPFQPLAPSAALPVPAPTPPRDPSAPYQIPCDAPPSAVVPHICHVTVVDDMLEILVAWPENRDTRYIAVGLGAVGVPPSYTDMVSIDYPTGEVTDRGGASGAILAAADSGDASNNWMLVEGARDVTQRGFARLRRPVISPDTTDFVVPTCVGTATKTTIGVSTMTIFAADPAIGTQAPIIFDVPCVEECDARKWVAMSNCSMPCGEGVQWWRQEATARCALRDESRRCETLPCYSACVYGEWLNTTECSKPCQDEYGNGTWTQRRTAVCSECGTPEATARICTNVTRTSSCNAHLCGTDPPGTLSVSPGTGRVTGRSVCRVPQFGATAPSTTLQCDVDRWMAHPLATAVSAQYICEVAQCSLPRGSRVHGQYVTASGEITALSRTRAAATLGSSIVPPHSLSDRAAVAAQSSVIGSSSARRLDVGATCFSGSTTVDGVSMDCCEKALRAIICNNVEMAECACNGRTMACPSCDTTFPAGGGGGGNGSSLSPSAIVGIVLGALALAFLAFLIIATVIIASVCLYRRSHRSKAAGMTEIGVAPPFVPPPPGPGFYPPPPHFYAPPPFSGPPPMERLMFDGGYDDAYTDDELDEGLKSELPWDGPEAASVILGEPFGHPPPHSAGLPPGMPPGLPTAFRF